ncbi:MAG: pseudouridine synthase [Cyanobacteriota/Melainabacteria group bacterium]
MEAIPVLYRDPRLLFVDKPTGMIIHRGYDRDPITVADIVRDKIIGAQVFALHRLDRGTSGVVGFALDSEMAAKMQGALKELQNTEKEYVALVRGPMKEPVDLDYPVPNKAGGERVPAQTLFLPLASTGRWTPVKAYPCTGRYHQIRRHQTSQPARGRRHKVRQRRGQSSFSSGLFPDQAFSTCSSPDLQTSGKWRADFNKGAFRPGP